MDYSNILYVYRCSFPHSSESLKERFSFSLDFLMWLTHARLYFFARDLNGFCALNADRRNALLHSRLVNLAVGGVMILGGIGQFIHIGL